MSPLKPVPRVDSQGQMCGSLFKVEIILITDLLHFFLVV
jgi:hypothetical protein